jgi:hypothetical protein
VVCAFAGIDDALEALEDGSCGREGVAGGGSLHFRVLIQVGVDSSLPEFGFHAAEAAEAPFIVYKGVDEEALGGIGRAVLFVKFNGKFGEIFGGFVEHDLALGVDAVLQSVVSGFGLAFGTGGGRGTFVR